MTEGFQPEWDFDKSLFAWMYVHAVGVCPPELYQKVVNHALHYGITTAAEMERRWKEQQAFVADVQKRGVDFSGLDELIKNGY